MTKKAKGERKIIIQTTDTHWFPLGKQVQSDMQLLALRKAELPVFWEKTGIFRGICATLYPKKVVK